MSVVDRVRKEPERTVLLNFLQFRKWLIFVSLSCIYSFGLSLQVSFMKLYERSQSYVREHLKSHESYTSVK